MKSIAVSLVFTTLVASAPVMAITYSFQPYPDVDLQDLPHSYYYGWKINWTGMPENEDIVAASLTIGNLSNWRSVSGLNKDVLFLQMMDWTGSAPVGMSTYLSQSSRPGYTSRLYRGYDRPAGVSEADVPPINAFTTGVSLGSVDAFSYTPGANAVINFDAAQLAALSAYLSDSRVFFGFDPDCHWYNSGIRLDIATQPRHVPDGGTTLVLLGLGLLGLHQARRFNSKS